MGDNPERILMTEVGKKTHKKEKKTRINFYILTKDSSGRGLDKVESDRRRRDTQVKNQNGMEIPNKDRENQLRIF